MITLVKIFFTFIGVFKQISSYRRTMYWCFFILFYGMCWHFLVFDDSAYVYSRFCDYAGINNSFDRVFEFLLLDVSKSDKHLLFVLLFTAIVNIFLGYMNKILLLVFGSFIGSNTANCFGNILQNKPLHSNYFYFTIEPKISMADKEAIFMELNGKYSNICDDVFYITDIFPKIKDINNTETIKEIIESMIKNISEAQTRSFFSQSNLLNEICTGIYNNPNELLFGAVIFACICCIVGYMIQPDYYAVYGKILSIIKGLKSSNDTLLDNDIAMQEALINQRKAIDQLYSLNEAALFEISRLFKEMDRKDQEILRLKDINETASDFIETVFEDGVIVGSLEYFNRFYNDINNTEEF